MAISMGLAALVLALAGADPTPATAQSYTLRESRVAPATADGRYALKEASASVKPAPTTPDGRFKLVEIRQPAVGCDPFPEVLFANGFE